jgi:hypothetical protein
MLDSLAGGWLHLPGRCMYGGCEWLIIDLGRVMTVYGVVIQARRQQSYASGYMTQFIVDSDVVSTFTSSSIVYPANGLYSPLTGFFDARKFFPTSTWTDVKKEVIMFWKPALARYIKITELAWVGSGGTRAGVSVADEWYKCAACPQNTVTNNSGSLACEACAAGKTTDRRTGQVECVCDVGTEHGTDGECVTCPAGRYKATSTDKYANRACVNCSSCAANQQVNTECNNTHDVTCRACQPNSWSYAGRTELEPCLCNAGYELQGQLCVACAVGKARQVNNNNSIVCETCGAGTFTSVSASITCGVCSAICDKPCAEKIFDFSPYYGIAAWKAAAEAWGMTYRLFESKLVP